MSYSEQCEYHFREGVKQLLAWLLREHTTVSLKSKWLIQRLAVAHCHRVCPAVRQLKRRR